MSREHTIRGKSQPTSTREYHVTETYLFLLLFQQLHAYCGRHINGVYSYLSLCIFLLINFIMVLIFRGFT